MRTTASRKWHLDLVSSSKWHLDLVTCTKHVRSSLQSPVSQKSKAPANLMFGCSFLTWMPVLCLGIPGHLLRKEQPSWAAGWHYGLWLPLEPHVFQPCCEDDSVTCKAISTLWQFTAQRKTALA